VSELGDPEVAARDASVQAGGQLRTTILLLVGVFLLQLGFIFSYVAAFHDPKPHRVSVALVAPASLASRGVGAIDAIPNQIATARALPSTTVARKQILNGSISAAIIFNPASTTDQVLYASGGGAAVATTVEKVATEVETKYGRHVTFTDLVPLQAGDARGLTGFYLVIGWIVGGYLMASILGIANGTRPSSVREAATRLLAIVPYAAASGLGGALIVDEMLGALTGHFLALWSLGVLVVAASAAATMAFEALLGIAGIGIVILAFVILGNPSAGGPYQPELLPGFWRAISGWLPNGAGTDTVRRIVYFDSHGITGHLLVLAGYILVGAITTLAVCRSREVARMSTTSRRGLA
jgi:hypothetical protein